MEEIGSISSSPYNKLLNEVHSMTLSMGRLVEGRLLDARKASKRHDIKLANTIAGSDHKVNKIELTIDEKCVKLLALYNPKARDLRLIVSLLKILVDVERIGDEVQRIARNLSDMNHDEVPDKMFVELDRLGERVSHMLDEILTALGGLESRVYSEVRLQDNKVDEEWSHAMGILTSFLSTASANIDSLLKVLWCARSLERIGDHIKNIGEYIVFAAEGKDIRHSSGRVSERVPAALP